MTSVAQLLKQKESTLWSIAPEQTVYSALQLMAEKDVGALLVIQQGKLVGIFSERDYARKLILMGKFSKETAVSELMTQDVLYVGPEHNLENCMVLMSNKRIRHLPVIDRGEILGIVTIGDAVKQIIRDREHTIHQLENYISGGY